jgi:hypothetical protein
MILKVKGVVLPDFKVCREKIDFRESWKKQGGTFFFFFFFSLASNRRSGPTAPHLIWRRTRLTPLFSYAAPCLVCLKVPSFFTLFLSHQFLTACMEY